jgi:hypothetical protein
MATFKGISAAILLLGAATLVHAQAVPAEPPKPKVYALVSAVGEKFHVIYEKMSTGSNLSPFRRSTIDVPDGTLNKVVLKSLDAAVARTDPTARRTYLALSTPKASRRGAVSGEELIEWIVTQLRPMPERAGWDSILVAIPAYRALAKDRLPNRLEGLGIFAQPLCQSDPDSCQDGTRSLKGPEVQTPEGETINASYFIAPYSLIEVWVLDPKTLEVLDRGEAIEHQKMYDPKSTAINIFNNVESAVLAERVLGLVESSVAAAVADSEKRGKVDVRMRKEIKPE